MRCNGLAKRAAATKDVTCPCGTVFRQKPGTNRTHCSDNCRREHGGREHMSRVMSAQRRGAGNPAYKHGRRVGVIIRWKLERKGEHACRNCGTTEGRIELHHAIPRSKCKAIEADLRNALPLCRDCHMGWHYKKVTIYRSVFTLEEWNFLRDAPMTGQNAEAWLEKHYPPRPQTRWRSDAEMESRYEESVWRYRPPEDDLEAESVEGYG